MGKVQKNKLNSVKKIKIFNDPIYGFVHVHNKLVYKIIQHPYFQRLRRISQMGLSYLVYPGAHHTRFHHALGCVFLMQKGIDTLRLKGVKISNQEEEGLLISILLHDIGHGPFSHALENSIVSTDHEEISLQFMRSLNKEFDGKLDLAIDIFTNRYPRKFMHQLVSGQLDMDRLDYLKRDSFYTGVAEGNINSDRLISMMTVFEDQLVLEEKGIYSAEKFILARRMMYWMAYLHKTGVAAEHVLVNVLKRAKELIGQGIEVQCTEALSYFLKAQKAEVKMEALSIHMFALLDDNDVLSALKLWSGHADLVLAELCRSLLNRKLPKIEMFSEPIPQGYVNKKELKYLTKNQIDRKDIGYFVFTGEIKLKVYDSQFKNIQLLNKQGDLLDLAESSDLFRASSFSESISKYYICYPK
ncbi:HD domain-containing protein [Namhaeicola litoreus]|uniref:HD domain-containing protein n=1 Tax=Namhaeicola litoreus TaxID=1052145 RepID=A0ABW3Y4X3_9FLAO